MKFFLLIALLVSCAQMPTPVEKSPEVAVDVMKPEVAKPEVAPAPTPAPIIKEKKVRIAIVKLLYFKTGEARFRKIVANVEEVINSKKFEDKVRGFKYLGASKMVSTTDTPDQVYEKITSKDWQLDYRLEIKRYGSVIGYTYPNVEWIILYSKFWYSLADADIARNICHEYGGHKLGRYGHDMNWSKPRDSSAPYAIGSICGDVYEEMFP